MTKLTASRLQEAALARFAKQGFDSTSMNEIAADVGIKKPSVYAHFRSKDELLLSVIPLVIEAELEYARSVLRGGDDMEQQLLAYLQGIEERFNDSYRVQFWVRILFAPPVHLYDAVMEPMHIFMDDLEHIIKKAIQKSPLVSNANRLSADVLAMTCMSMIDSLQSELLFGGVKKYQRRLKSVWAVFETAIAPLPDGSGR